MTRSGNLLILWATTFCPFVRGYEERVDIYIVIDGDIDNIEYLYIGEDRGGLTTSM